ncbi:MAG: pyridoxamine 5'-phosphate oxidase family protein [Saonia sp.]
MTDTFFDELTKELRKGATEKTHPFRYFTLGTVGLDRAARLRTVVLRKITDDRTILFYTDKRSKKIIHIMENNKVSLLFYHPKKLLQLKVDGLAQVVADETRLKEYRSSIHPNSRKDYTTTIAPGSPIDHPDAVEYLKDKDHFSVVEVKPFKIEYLKLKRPNHLRVRFSKNENLWIGEFLVP